MRWRPLIWLVASLVLLAVLWRLGFFSNAPRALAEISDSGSAKAIHPAGADSVVPTREQTAKFPHRLSNSSKTVDELARSDKAILLENALLDTELPLELPIPAELGAVAEPGSYLVQCKGSPDSRFQDLLKQNGAKIISYIPNNAYLVRGSVGVAKNLAAAPEVQAVVPYQPYYKLQPGLLSVALRAGSSSANNAVTGETPLSLNILLFADSSDVAVETVRALSTEVQAIEQSPFGPEVKVRASPQVLSRLASLPDVEEIELSRPRAAATDLSRATIGTAANSTTVSNYLGLTGTNVLVNVNDTGVDSSYPGLTGRVQSDLPAGSQDTTGHGTHVAGIIAGNGTSSPTVTNAPGSVLPAVDYQFRGHAPAASIFSISVSPSPATDSYLQQSTAKAGAFISNNSWHYAGANEYDLAAASYDAAVRDALPGTPGPQPVLYVFAAGNRGGGLDDGTGGVPETIQSPATAKNVITVGALKQLRLITNQTWTCDSGPGNCRTNAPWAAMTDAPDEVAAFSSRGNVGIGSEGEFGRFKPDVVAPGTFVVSGRSTQWDQTVYYSDSNNAVVPFPDANYFEVLSNLNNGLGPAFRFESGTSLAAASVSGTLALMQEFFEQRLGAATSPALMKALLINGARSLTNLYGLSPQTRTNAQGWGLIHLPNSVPAALTNSNPINSPLLLFDQNAAQALATGQSKTRIIAVSPTARNQPLRITLVWTDPPANPVAATKLVNDLDLIVTNLDSGEVFFGNDIPLGGSFNSPAAPGARDFINNVENVYLAPELGGNYSVTVLGRRVTVNAVTEQTNSIAQDYALVISSGDCRTAGALALTQERPVALAVVPSVTIVPNAFGIDSGDFGSILFHQRAGANSPLATNAIALATPPGAILTIGEIPQWHFYVFTNTPGFSNVAFLTFLAEPVGLGLAVSNKSPSAADLDLYVSTDPTLTNLNPTALANADASLGRGGEEMIVYSNAAPVVFYVGVKAESQAAVEYGFIAIASAAPFAQADAAGNELLRGFSVPAPIPGGQDSQPGVATIFALCPDVIPVRRVVVTNTLTCSSLPALKSTLCHNGADVVLGNHSGTGMIDHATFIYDDSAERDVDGAQHSDGPGNLLWFGGGNGFGQWRLDLATTNAPGTDDAFSIFLERQQDLGASVSISILPSACREDFIDLPLTATNLTAIVSFGSGTGPISMQVCRRDDPFDGCLEVPMSVPGTNGMIILDATSHPPLNPGAYVIRVCNLGPDMVTANITSLTGSALAPAPLEYFISTNLVSIPDDALSVSAIEVTNSGRILSVEVGVRLDHPRVSDLTLRLVSPEGTAVLLEANRGGTASSGLGCDTVVTNTIPVSYSGGSEAVTNIIETRRNSGVIGINYDFYALPDEMRVYYDGVLLYDSGLVGHTGSTNLAYGPGESTSFTVVINEGGNPNPNTIWFYSVTATQLSPVDLTFTEDTNLTSVPIKFAATPLTNFNYFGTDYRAGNGIFYLPEETLDKLAGESAFGRWELQITDSRAGATTPPPELVTWQLGIRFLNTTPAPIQLAPGQLITNLLAGTGQIQWFSVPAPSWVSFVTNSLLLSSAPVNLLFNQYTPPTGTNSGDVFLLTDVISDTVLLRTNGSSAFIPGATFYLGVQNTNSSAVSFLFAVDFDIDNVISLQNGMPYTVNNPGPATMADYFRYVVSTNAVRAQFEINGPSGDVTLLARKGPPPPTLAAYNYRSSNAGTNDELIVIYDYSSPVPLAPGEWFLTVVNHQDEPANYTIVATEFTAYGTNLDIVDENLSSNMFCLSWNSLPGAHYFIEGKASLDDTNWLTLSPTLTASDVFTTYCVATPNPFGFFRIGEGLVLTPPPLLIDNISYGSSGVFLHWLAATNDQFQVEWTTSPDPSQWISFTNILTSADGVFSFLDDGSQSGGPAQTRFYRLRRLP